MIIPSTKTHASYTVVGTGLNYANPSGVIDVRDTSEALIGISGTATDIHYLPTSAGDLQVYGDEAFVSTFVPAAFAALITPPNTYVDYLKTSLGINKSYPVTSLTQNVTQSGVTATVVATVTGAYMGIEAVTVPRGEYDTAYKFAIKVDVNVTAFGIPITSLSVTDQIWIVHGIGIVRTNLPSAQGTQFSLPGSERDMNDYGIRTLSSVAESPEPNLTRIYPNPTSDFFSIRASQQIRKVDFYSVSGVLVRSMDVRSAQPDILIATDGLDNGSYTVRVTFADGSTSLQRIVTTR